jgi:hypothetical protein
MDWYWTLVEESNDVATITDPDGTIAYVIPAVTRVLAYYWDEVFRHTGLGMSPFLRTTGNDIPTRLTPFCRPRTDPRLSAFEFHTLTGRDAGLRPRGGTDLMKT